MRTMIVAVALAAALPVHAQVYKCQEGGKTVFSDIPCATNARQIDARPATGAYNPEEGERARLNTEASSARLAAEEARRMAAREAALAELEASRASEQDQCASIRAKKQDAEHWAREFRHPDNIRREQAKADYWKDRLWWECKQLD